jgi:hypothetical protein
MVFPSRKKEASNSTNIISNSCYVSGTGLGYGNMVVRMTDTVGFLMEQSTHLERWVTRQCQSYMVNTTKAWCWRRKARPGTLVDKENGGFQQR